MVWGKCIELLNCRGGHALGGLSAALFRSPPPPRCIRPRRRSVPVQLTARVYASAETHWRWFEAAEENKKRSTPDGGEPTTTAGGRTFCEDPTGCAPAVNLPAANSRQGACRTSPRIRLCRNTLAVVRSSMERQKIKTTPDGVVFIFGSPCWARTNDNAVNSRVLYRLS